MNVKNDSTTEIAEAGRRFLQLFAANNIAGIAACYTEDAQLLAPNMDEIRGRKAIEAVFKFTGGRGHRLDFETRELDVYGTTAVELGRYVRRKSDGSTVDHGKYMLIWKRVGEQWKIHRDMFNTSALNGAVAGTRR